jgi:hypothetical protein
MYDKFFKVLSILAPPAPVIVGTWSLVMLVGCAYSIYTTKQVSMPVSVIFSAVLTNFTAHKIATVMNGTAPVDNNDTNLDVQGDSNANPTQPSK